MPDLRDLTVEQIDDQTDPADMPKVDAIPESHSEAVTWQEFHQVRNAVLEVCSRFGSVGPMGPASITNDADGPPEPWPVADQQPEFFVVDDMLNTWERSQRVELKDPRSFDEGFVRALHSLLTTRYPRWSLGISLGKGYLLLSTQRAYVRGPMFRRCKTVGDALRVPRA